MYSYVYVYLICIIYTVKNPEIVTNETRSVKQYLLRVYCAGEEDGSEIGGSGVHFPLHMGETPSQSTEE